MIDGCSEDTQTQTHTQGDDRESRSDVDNDNGEKEEEKEEEKDKNEKRDTRRRFTPRGRLVGSSVGEGPLRPLRGHRAVV